MNVAIYARTSAADAGRITVEEILADLTAHASRRGWKVALECADRGPALVGRREGLQRLAAAVRTRQVQAVLVRSLAELARSLRHLAELGQLLAESSVALVALAERIDTADPGGAIRWSDWLEISLTIARQHRSEATTLARLRTPWGSPVAAVNPVELQALWEGRGPHRLLSQREIAAKLGVSPSTVRQHLRELREAGKVDNQARAADLRGRPRRGGRRSVPLDDAALTTAWKRLSSVYAIALQLGVRRSRVEARLRELGLRPERRSPK